MQTYIRYLQEVLGIKSVLMPAQKLQPALLILTGDLDYTTAEQELLDKMIQATKLTKESIEIRKTATDIDELKNYQAILCFDKKVSDWIGLHSNDVSLITTHGPRELIAKPELKKQAWTDMQKALSNLNS